MAYRKKNDIFVSYPGTPQQNGLVWRDVADFEGCLDKVTAFPASGHEVAYAGNEASPAPLLIGTPRKRTFPREGCQMEKAQRVEAPSGNAERPDEC